MEKRAKSFGNTGPNFIMMTTAHILKLNIQISLNSKQNLPNEKIKSCTLTILLAGNESYL